MSKDDIPQVEQQQLDAVLRFLPLFDRPECVFGEWHNPPGQFPFWAPSEEVMAFLVALDQARLVFPFDWPNWQDEAARYVSDPRALETADLLVLRKLLTTHVRLNRFVEGHLASVLESGHITAILRRLQAIREELAHAD